MVTAQIDTIDEKQHLSSTCDCVKEKFMTGCIAILIPSERCVKIWYLNIPYTGVLSVPCIQNDVMYAYIRCTLLYARITTVTSLTPRVITLIYIMYV